MLSWVTPTNTIESIFAIYLKYGEKKKKQMISRHNTTRDAFTLCECVLTERNVSKLQIYGTMFAKIEKKKKEIHYDIF